MKSILNNSQPAIFFIGVGRSGTTIIFEAFARHPELAWISNYCRRFPKYPVVNLLRPLLDNRLIRLYGKKSQYRKKCFGKNLLPRPAEAYNFWDIYTGVPFSMDYLKETQLTPSKLMEVRKAVTKVRRYQIKPRFSAKFTGPPRIAFLQKIFPNAVFIHIIRDGRAVVHSLLHVKFRQKNGGLEHPYWKNGLPEQYEEIWHKSGDDPGVLAAVQWRYIIERTRIEKLGLQPSQYKEVRYEDFIAAPETVLRDILHFCHLPESEEVLTYFRKEVLLQNMNAKYKTEFDKNYLKMLSEVMQPVLKQLNYTDEPF